MKDLIICEKRWEWETFALFWVAKSLPPFDWSLLLTCVNLNVFNFFTFWFTNFVLFYQFDYSWSFGYFAYDLESSLVLRSDNSSILKWKVTKVNFVASKWTWFSTFELVQLDLIGFSIIESILNTIPAQSNHLISQNGQIIEESKPRVQRIDGWVYYLS